MGDSSLESQVELTDRLTNYLIFFHPKIENQTKKHQPKMMHLTRRLRHLTPKQFKNGTGIHDGLRPRIQPKQDISALIQVSRWAFLLYGIYYGNQEWHRIAKIRGAEKKAEIAALDKMLAEEAAAKEKANQEFMKDSILYGTSQG